MTKIFGFLTAALFLAVSTISAQAQGNCADPCAPGCSEAGSSACSGGAIRQSSGGTRTYNPGDSGGGTRSAQPAAGGRHFSFRVCNKSRKKASVALSYRNNKNKWIVQGWWTIQVGDCRRLGSFRKGYFYYFAKNYSGSGEWRGKFKLCVEIPKAFKRVNRTGYKCPNRLLKKVIEKQVKTSKYTWNLLK